MEDLINEYLNANDEVSMIDKLDMIVNHRIEFLSNVDEQFTTV